MIKAKNFLHSSASCQIVFTMHDRSRLIRIGGSMVKFVDMTDVTAIHNNSKLFRIEKSMVKCFNMALDIVNFFMNA